MEYLKYLNTKLKYNSFLRFFFQGLEKLGIVIEPYYVFTEGLFTVGHMQCNNDFGNYTIESFNADDMREIAVMPYRNTSYEYLTNLLERGKKCIGIKHGGKIVSFVWMDIDVCTLRELPIKKLEYDEACLFDGYTVVPYRGKGLSSYLYYHVYKFGETLGKKKFYAVCNVFNKSTLKVRNKMNSQVESLGLYIKLFNKLIMNKTIKRYDKS